jgi:hypothetical protein
MNKRTKGLIVVLAMVAALPVVARAENSPTKTDTNVKPASIPAGSLLHVRLQTTLSDKFNKTGDTFTALVTQPITVNGQDVVPAGSTVNGRVAFVKPSGRVKGKAQLRIILDNITTTDGVQYPMTANLEDTRGGECASKTDEEGKIEGCGKNKKDALKGAALAGAVGAGAGATVGMAAGMQCGYYGCWPGGIGSMATGAGYGAAIGGGTALLYSLFKHEKHIILVQGTDLTFVIGRTAEGRELPPDSGSTDSTADNTKK